MTTDQFVTENVEAIAKEYENNGNDMGEAIRTIAINNYNSWVSLFEKVNKNDGEIKKYLFECRCNKKVPFVC